MPQISKSGLNYLEPDALGQDIARLVFEWMRQYGVEPDYRRVSGALDAARTHIKANWNREVVERGPITPEPTD